MTQAISFGAGVNSVAMTIILIEKGWHGPILFADPGNEHPETYCYMTSFERNYLMPRGLQITRLSPATHRHLYGSKLQKAPNVTTLEEYCLHHGIIPLLAVRWCSVEFKRTPLNAWLQANGYRVTCLGITSDEPRRIRHDPTIRYPLDEAGITRQECYRIIQRAGLDLPRKSGCWFCPGQPLSQWRDLWLNHPDLFERAIGMETNAAEHNQKHATLDPHGVKLHDMRAKRWKGQIAMDLSHWLPCACRL